MKVIRHSPLRRRAFRSPSTVEEVPEQPPANAKKKALLIGIRYCADGDVKTRRVKMHPRGGRGCEEDSDSDTSDDNDREAEEEELKDDGSTKATTVETEGDEERARGQNGVLLGPHRDVLGMKGVLIAHYGYKEEDITIMMDDGRCAELQPRRENILKKMDELVRDAQPGDHFFFHYSGHSTQQDSDTNEEEDGLDEYLVALDDELIKDNELLDHLVKPLPAKTKLTAVFDSCHSASLLDLPHNRCNRVYVPWISKGHRRSMTHWNRNVRKDAADNPLPSSRPHSPRRQLSFNKLLRWKQSSIDQVLNSPSPPASMGPTPASTFSSGKAFNLPPSDGRKNSNSTVSNGSDVMGKKQSPSSGNSTSNTYQTSANAGKPHQKVSTAKPKPSILAKLKRSSLSLRTDFENLCGTLSPWKQCMSPEPMFLCDGWCRERCGWGVSGADVLSLSASKDSQRAWERANGDSMTQVLIRILNENPNPTLEDLLLSLSHDLHQFYLELHRVAKDYKKRWREKESENLKTKRKRKRKEVEMDNFQDPQISSQHPLDLRDKWQP